MNDSTSLAESLSKLTREQRDEVLDELSDAQAQEVLFDWNGFWARPEQLAPDGAWDIWLALAGRGWGKTRTGSEWIRQRVDAGYRRIALIAETAADARDVLVEGDSGILNVYPEKDRPLYEPSKRRVTWQNGAVATLFNATEPNQLRGPQYDTVLCDELAKWRYARETWDMMQFGLRIGDKPQCLVTTTPRPIELVKAIIAGREGRVAVTRGRTMDNRSNLAKSFLSRIEARYAGTRLGRQELDGEILSDIPNALWSYAQLDVSRIKDAPEDMSRILVAVDPAVTNTEDSDYHGVMAVGSLDNDGYVLEDGSLKGSPLDWARRAIALHDSWQADGIVVEVNQGGDMVAQTLRSVRENINVIEVRATRGKHVRAEPIAAMYEQGRIHHVGSFPELETQMTLMTSAGYEGEDSPDRLDALVWGMTELFPSMIDRVIEIEPESPRTNAGWMGL